MPNQTGRPQRNGGRAAIWEGRGLSTSQWNRLFDVGNTLPCTLAHLKVCTTFNEPLAQRHITTCCRPNGSIAACHTTARAESKTPNSKGRKEAEANVGEQMGRKNIPALLCTSRSKLSSDRR